MCARLWSVDCGFCFTFWECSYVNVRQEGYILQGSLFRQERGFLGGQNPLYRPQGGEAP